MATISVIIPAYNAEHTIRETIASVQNQTFSDFEIIVIDDQSRDRTLEVLHAIQDERLKVFSYENGGASVARNRGIDHATGEFIAFLDADDLWTPNKLERQIEALQKNPEAGVAYSWTYYFFKDEKSSYIEKSNCFEGNVYANLLVTNFLHNGSNPLVRRKAIDSVGLFDPNIRSVEDWDYWLRLSAKWNFVLVREPQIIYRQHSQSVSENIEAMEKNCLALVDKSFQTAPQELQFLKTRTLIVIYQYLAQKYLNRASHSYKDVNFAGQKLWAAICLQPKILLEQYTQSLIRGFLKKWIFTQLLPSRQKITYEKPIPVNEIDSNRETFV
ncbi:glycosyl transferase family A [Scytonema hofmannii PCC 7110]|uniref:Glycosyl transferase family A n=1 Tax=Scytonema hofmannii PCC 7110 TaxID=128403 RepID=A0A139X6Z7_9CYAN|nr:glycosyltransferase [Scytonema hofmannii]KYC40467.1 glycosyl transferase family A [Scytonema hofmannii PCC 7110]